MCTKMNSKMKTGEAREVEQKNAHKISRENIRKLFISLNINAFLLLFFLVLFAKSSGRTARYGAYPFHLMSN